MTKVNFDELLKLIKEALEMLYYHDSHLINNYSGCSNSVGSHNTERAVVFRIGIYLEKLLESEEWFKNYNLDCEYNRDGYDIKKSSNGRRICPDMVVHQRNKNGENGENLLVIEVKTWWNYNSSDDNIEMDVKKIIDMQEKYGYLHGIVIYIGKDIRKSCVLEVNPQGTLCQNKNDDNRKKMDNYFQKCYENCILCEIKNKIC